jgi:hypothetical protein
MPTLVDEKKEVAWRCDRAIRRNMQERCKKEWGECARVSMRDAEEPFLDFQ